MSLPAGQRRMLDRIERALQASEPRLAAMFAIFNRLASSDGPIATERIRAPRLRLWPKAGFRAAMLTPVAIGLMITGIVLGGTAHGAGGCLRGWHSVPATPARGSVGCVLDMRPVRAVRPAKPTSTPKPARTATGPRHA